MSRSSQRHARQKEPKRVKKRYVVLIILAVLILGAVLSAVIWWQTFVKPPERAENVGVNQKTPKEEEREEITLAEGVYTFLVVGTDKEDYNTDTMMVVTFDTDNDKINILSIPRDTMIRTTWNSKKINSAYAVGGIEQLEKEIKKLIGFAPEHYIKVNLDAFVEIIDAMGGVKIDVKQDMNYDDPYQNLSIHLKKGEQVLNGQEAMGFVRFRRYPQGDIARIEAQQQFVAAVAEQLTSPANLPSTIAKLPTFADIISENMETSLSVGEIVWFGKQLAEVDMALNLHTYTLPGHDQYISGISYYLPQGSAILEMINQSFNPYDTPITKLDLVNVNQVTANENKKPAKTTDNDKKDDDTTKPETTDDDKTADEGAHSATTKPATNDSQASDKQDANAKDDGSDKPAEDKQDEDTPTGDDSDSESVLNEFGQPVTPDGTPTSDGSSTAGETQTPAENQTPTEAPPATEEIVPKDDPLANEVLP